MLAATRKWFRRNRSTLTIGLGVLGAGYVATQYVLTKFAEARERDSSERISRDNLRRRFEQNQDDCTFTVLALLPTATENVLDALPVENITHELQLKKAERRTRTSPTLRSDATSERSSGPPSIADDDGKSLRSFQSESYVHASQAVNGGESQESERSRRSKAQLWAELKISSVTRTFTLIYILALLNLLTRVQLNLLGRRNYLSSVVSLAYYPGHSSTISLENREDVNMENAYSGDFEANRRYLTFSWWLLHRGWKELADEVEAAVQVVFGPVDPREDVMSEKVSQLTLEIRKRVEGSTVVERRNRKWLSYLLPPRDQEEFVLRESGVISSSSTSIMSSGVTSSATTLRRLLDETSDLIDSPSFSHVLTQLLDAGFSLLVDRRIAELAYKQSPFPLSPAPPPPPPPPPPPHPPHPSSHPPSSSSSSSSSSSTKTAKVANILAVISRQADLIGNGHQHGVLSNEYLQAMNACRDLDAFSAVIYSSNFDDVDHRSLDVDDVHDTLTSSLYSAFDSRRARRDEDEKKEENNESNIRGELGEDVDKIGEPDFEKAWGSATATDGRSHSPSADDRLITLPPRPYSGDGGGDGGGGDGGGDGDQGGV